MKGELTGVSEASPSESYARLGYHAECEAAVNDQINVEYTISVRVMAPLMLSTPLSLHKREFAVDDCV